MQNFYNYESLSHMIRDHGKLQELLSPQRYSGSKDWTSGDLVSRVEWLIAMYEGARTEVNSAYELMGRSRRPDPTNPYEVWKNTSVSIDSDVMGGQPCLKGTRITLKRIASYALAGETYGTIFRDFPILKPRDIRFAVQFIKENHGKIPN